MPAPPQRGPGYPLLVLLGAVGIGIAIGVAVVPRSAHRLGVIPSKVTLGGMAIGRDATGSYWTSALETARQILSRPMTLRIDEESAIVVGQRQLGVQLDRTRLRQLTLDVADASSPTNRLIGGATPTSAVTALPLPVRLQDTTITPFLMRLKDKVDQQPRNARLRAGSEAPLPEQVGLRLDVDASMLAIQSAIERGQSEVLLVAERVRPRLLAAQLEQVDRATVLGSFDTPYDLSRRSQARTFNLRLAASRLDGTVLMPGEVFDFNQVVGPRDEANGYQVAPVIAQGELVDGIGGGTCQISGTLHAAALFAGLDVVDRTPHTRPSSYIKLGLDAAVVYPTINLALRNPYDFPVVIREWLDGGKVFAEVRGKERPFQVRLIRKIDSAGPYPVSRRESTQLPLGHERVTQSGVPSLKLHLYRIFETAYHSRRERIAAEYPATTEIVEVGVGARSKAHRSKNERHASEYTPDELLIFSQREEPGSGYRVEREAGRFGTPGWTESLQQSFQPNGRM